MKKYLLVAVLFTSVNLVQAQMKEGTIVYERKIDVHRRMEDDQMKAMIPQFRTDRHELLFKENETLYRGMQEEDAPDPFANSGGPGAMIIRFGPGDGGVIYRNYGNAKHEEQTELEDKTYIIDDTIKQQPWKLSADETKTLNGRNCKKATLTTERGNEVVAWYAEDIASPAGPENFGGLPGAILMMDINNGEMVYTAIEIKPDFASKDLKEPGKGTHLTRAEFRKKLDDLFGPPDANGRIVRRF